MADWIVFWIIAPISVVSAVAMVVARNAVHSALLLIVNFFTLAVFFLVLGSPFLFVVQIIVYAGAIMVLFLFVIMLLGVDRRDSQEETIDVGAADDGAIVPDDASALDNAGAVVPEARS